MNQSCIKVENYRKKTCIKEPKNIISSIGNGQSNNQKVLVNGKIQQVNIKNNNRKLKKVCRNLIADTNK